MIIIIITTTTIIILLLYCKVLVTILFKHSVKFWMMILNDREIVVYFSCLMMAFVLANGIPAIYLCII